MKKLEKRKKTLLLLWTYVVIITTPKVNAYKDYEVTFNEEYEINNLEPFASYSNGDIYIGDKKYINSIRNDETDDIYVIDTRNDKNPDMTICNSYEIHDKYLMKIVLDILLEYERENPSRWNRTKDSMFNEWMIHNICYDISLKRSSTEEVDLDNNDEEKYNSKILSKLLR